ncbi:abhydrolase, alpha/beta hydrolase fold [[Actinomadura] parvosata subsp. kistnae]|uniref:alpha/beta fold hydrolase n=1 Tax=[Actinomadura] parvosata TaxID=1955412 RepID=UPI0009AD6A69|nr:alpha/beta fold hydrolase [Nonomuraea sp. ATCC 55076]SPL98004.1 abhydrolase, alpha/beta hydrolase fold [Actinomadura parvosata subsp. kistnae]
MTGTSPAVGHLRVDGANIRYEVRGSGPLLLLIPGGTGGAAAFDGVADDLAGEHTVVSYDPRGLSRSPLDDPEAPQTVAQQADDAYRLLELLAPGAPARVAGCSSGAIAALHLLATHPERIERVVAHEPPLVEVLPDAAVHRAMLARVTDTLHREGLMPAATMFAAGLAAEASKDPAPASAAPASGAPASADQAGGTPASGTPAGGAPAGGTPASGAPAGGVSRSDAPASAAPVELPPQAAARAERTLADLPYFLGRIVPSFMTYAPDLERLRTLSDRLVLAAGEDSRGELPHRTAACLAERLGTEFVLFPGGHVGLTTHPAEFGALLRKVLNA